MTKMMSRILIGQLAGGIFLCAASFAQGAPADPGAEVPAALNAVQIDHVSLSVQDLDREVAWYERAFGMKETNRVERGPLTNINLRNSNFRIDLIKYTGSVRTPADPVYMQQGWAHLAMSAPDLPAVKAALVARNIEVKGTNALVLRDPEGNEIEIFPRK